MTCPRCGLNWKIAGASVFCPACGYHVLGPEESSTHGGASSGPGNPMTVIPFPSASTGRDPVNNLPTVSSSSSLHRYKWFGSGSFQSLSGTVLAVEPLFMARRESNWLVIVAKLALGVALLPVIIGILAALALISFVFSFLGSSGGGRPGFISNVSSQVMGFFLTRKMLGPKEQDPVRDIRLRDKSGQEHLIRIQGELISGNVSVGDEIEVEGMDRRGTLILSRGWNKRTHTEIIVKRR